VIPGYNWPATSQAGEVRQIHRCIARPVFPIFAIAAVPGTQHADRRVSDDWPFSAKGFVAASKRGAGAVGHMGLNTSGNE
jgi:hypothetical protein